MVNLLGCSKYKSMFQYYDTDSVKEPFHNGDTHALKVDCELPKEGEVIVSKDKVRCVYDDVARLL